MIRLAMSCEEALGQEIAPRLRGAAIGVCFDASRMPAHPEACDAVAFVGQSCSEPGLIKRCLSAGKHVLLAAESWLSSGVLETLTAAAQRADVRLSIVNPDRYLPSRQLIRQQLDAGSLGEPGLVRMHRWAPYAAEIEGSPPELPSTLARDLDLALWLVAKLPNLVYAVEPKAFDGNSLPGRVVQVHLGFPGGGMALIDNANCLPPGDVYQSLSVIGSAGAAYADDHQNVQLVYRGGRPQAVRVDEGARQLAVLVQEFVHALEAGSDLSPSVSAWRSVLQVVDAVQKSLESRQAIPLEVR